MNPNLNEVMRRTYRYYYEDGLVEMAVGGLFALIGLVILGYQRAQGNPALVLAGSLGLMAVTGGGVFAVKWAVMRLKSRVTYPRTGKVTHNAQPGMGRWLLLGAIALLVLLGFFLPEAITTLPAMMGGLLTLILAFIGWRVGLLRLQLASLLPLAAGVLVTYGGLDELTGGALVFALTGGIMFALGGAALVRYLRSNPLPDEEA